MFCFILACTPIFGRGICFQVETGCGGGEAVALIFREGEL